MFRRTDSPPRDRLDSRRGQTSIDFVIGMSVFLLTVAFVVAFLPNVFDPFTTSDGGETLVADRTAGLLAEQLLVTPASPAVLDAACTEEFFDGDGATGDCRFDADAADLSAALGVGEDTQVNVTVEEGGTIQSSGGVELRAGVEPPERESVVVARRIVLLGDEEHDLYVRVW